jgi:hypothetical protein
MEQTETGALHQMMDNPPPADSAGIIWTTWGTPNSDPELEHQSAEIEDAFRQGWRPIGAGQPRALTERAYAQARAILSHGGWTGLDQGEPQSSGIAGPLPATPAWQNRKPGGHDHGGVSPRHGAPDRKIARNLPALRGLPTEMKKQIRRGRTRRTGFPPDHPVDG